MQMINIYVTIVGGGLLDEIILLIQCPNAILEVLGCQIPVISVYFMQVKRGLTRRNPAGPAF